MEKRSKMGCGDEGQRRAGDDVEAEIEEEEKMEKFYELIRRYTEVRALHQRLQHNGGPTRSSQQNNVVQERQKLSKKDAKVDIDDDDGDDKEVENKDDDNKGVAFEWEDFMDRSSSRRDHHQLASTSSHLNNNNNNNNKRKKMHDIEEGDEDAELIKHPCCRSRNETGLDLNLAL